MKEVGHSTTDRILAEAYERQFEIILLGEQEGATLKHRLVSAAKHKIDEEVLLLKLSSK